MTVSDGHTKIRATFSKSSTYDFHKDEGRSFHQRTLGGLVLFTDYYIVINLPFINTQFIDPESRFSILGWIHREGSLLKSKNLTLWVMRGLLPLVNPQRSRTMLAFRRPWDVLHELSKEMRLISRMSWTPPSSGCQAFQDRVQILWNLIARQYFQRRLELIP